MPKARTLPEEASLSAIARYLGIPMQNVAYAVRTRGIPVKQVGIVKLLDRASQAALLQALEEIARHPRAANTKRRLNRAKRQTSKRADAAEAEARARTAAEVEQVKAGTAKVLYATGLTARELKEAHVQAWRLMGDAPRLGREFADYFQVEMTRRARNAHPGEELYVIDDETRRELEESHGIDDPALDPLSTTPIEARPLEIDFARFSGEEIGKSLTGLLPLVLALRQTNVSPNLLALFGDVYMRLTVEAAHRLQ